MSIRICHTSDLHINERNRPGDTTAILAAIVHRARAYNVDLIVIAGDHFERRSTPDERNVLAEFLQDAAGVAPVVCVKGNHDAAEDLDIFARLETKHPVIVFDRPTSAPGSAMVICAASHVDRRIGILALPWFDKVHLVAELDATVDAEQSRNMTIEAANGLLGLLRAEAARLKAAGVIPILVGHVLVQGSEVATGQTLIGTTVELAPSELLNVGASCSLLGHIHMSQEWFGGRVAYSGSPNRCNFGESETKGWRLVTLTDDGEFVSSILQELPARRMVLLEEDLTTSEALENALHFTEDDTSDEVADALVRYRYRIRAQDLHLVDEAVLEAVLMRLGAHEVRIEAVVEAETRVRSEEIVRATSTAEKVEAFWRAKGIDVDEPTRDRVFGNLAELEAR